MSRLREFRVPIICAAILAGMIGFALYLDASGQTRGMVVFAYLIPTMLAVPLAAWGVGIFYVRLRGRMPHALRLWYFRSALLLSLALVLTAAALDSYVAVFGLVLCALVLFIACTGSEIYLAVMYGVSWYVPAPNPGEVPDLSHPAWYWVLMLVAHQLIVGAAFWLVAWLQESTQLEALAASLFSLNLVRGAFQVIGMFRRKLEE